MGIPKLKVEELKVLFKVAVCNALQVSLLQKNMKGLEQKKVNVEYKIQPYYPVVQLMSK